VTKGHEYARAGIPHYWIVDRDAAQTVTMCESARTMPLAWLLTTAPGEHGYAPERTHAGRAARIVGT